MTDRRGAPRDGQWPDGKRKGSGIENREQPQLEVLLGVIIDLELFETCAVTNLLRGVIDLLCRLHRLVIGSVCGLDLPPPLVGRGRGGEQHTQQDGQQPKQKSRREQDHASRLSHPRALSATRKFRNIKELFHPDKFIGAAAIGRGPQRPVMLELL